jgi:integration host factor subunit alpha
MYVNRKSKAHRTSTETKSEIRSTKFETNSNTQNHQIQILLREDVLISGFGKFCVKEKRERRGRNPAAGDSMMPAARRLVVYMFGQVEG